MGLKKKEGWEAQLWSLTFCSSFGPPKSKSGSFFQKVWPLDFNSFYLHSSHDSPVVGIDVSSDGGKAPRVAWRLVGDSLIFVLWLNVFKLQQMSARVKQTNDLSGLGDKS